MNNEDMFKNYQVVKLILCKDIRFTEFNLKKFNLFEKKKIGREKYLKLIRNYVVLYILTVII